MFLLKLKQNLSSSICSIKKSNINEKYFSLPPGKVETTTTTNVLTCLYPLSIQVLAQSYRCILRLIKTAQCFLKIVFKSTPLQYLIF